MTTAQSLQLWYPTILGGLFFFALGGNVGSFINVLAYRLPLGKSVVTPPSACPACNTRIRWYDNIPIFGWLALRGRCRYCKSPISIEYPIVEAMVAVLFLLAYLILFANPGLADILQVNRGAIEPDWGRGRWVDTWPAFGLVVVMLGTLFAVSLIDAKTFLIPIEMLWVLSAIALATHSAHAAATGPMHFAGGEHEWWIPLPPTSLVYPTLSGAAGLAVAIVLLKLNVIPQSYADYEEWERSQKQAREAHAKDSQTDGDLQPALPAASEFSASAGEAPHRDEDSAGSAVLRALVVAIPAVCGMILGPKFMTPALSQTVAMVVGACLGLVVGVVMRTLLVRQSDQQTAQDAELAGQTQHEVTDWTLYPHARRESVKETLFLALPTGAALGTWLFAPASSEAVPFWLHAMTGSLLGFLVGGAVVWFIRIAASIAFGKEAMGLGDVHLMAAIGAVAGWLTPTLGFFLAPFFGICVAILSAAMPAKPDGGPKHAIPYGPSLALASVIILLASPAVERFLSTMLNQPINLP